MGLFNKKQQSIYISIEDQMNEAKSKRLSDNYKIKKQNLIKKLDLYENVKKELIDIYEKLQGFVTPKNIDNYEQIIIEKIELENKKYDTFIEMMQKYNELINKDIEECYKTNKIEKFYLLRIDCPVSLDDKKLFLSQNKEVFNQLTNEYLNNTRKDLTNFIAFVKKENLAKLEIITDKEYTTFKNYIESKSYLIPKGNRMYYEVYYEISYENFLGMKNEYQNEINYFINEAFHKDPFLTPKNIEILKLFEKYFNSRIIRNDICLSI
jgi:hypothetical protein